MEMDKEKYKENDLEEDFKKNFLFQEDENIFDTEEDNDKDDKDDEKDDYERDEILWIVLETIREYINENSLPICELLSVSSLKDFLI